jgi:ketosteroid isomerase-like protein
VNRQDACRLISAYVEGWKTNDAPRVIGTLTQNCVIVESHGPTYRGLEIARRWIEGWLGRGNTVDRWDITSLHLAEAERVAVFEWEFECTADGVHYEIGGISIVEFEGDKIVALREYRMTEPPYDWPGGG